MIARRRHFVRLFQPRFAPLVETGIKPHTVRRTPNFMPCPADTISLRTWTGKPYRSRQRILREATITAVRLIWFSESDFIVDFRRWSPEQINAFAIDDGFSSRGEMLDWFKTTHGLPFEGIIICWR